MGENSGFKSFILSAQIGVLHDALFDSDSKGDVVEHDYNRRKNQRYCKEGA